MMWDWGGFGWIAGLLMMVLMVLFWGAIVWGLIVLLRGPVRRWNRGDRAEAEQTLAERFAGGEIDATEYRERLQVLRAASREP